MAYDVLISLSLSLSLHHMCKLLLKNQILKKKNKKTKKTKPKELHLKLKASTLTDTQKNKKIIYLLPFLLSNAKFIQIIKKNQPSIHNVQSWGS